MSEVQQRSGYTWKPPGRPIAIDITFPAIDKIATEVLRGFGVTRRRGTEAGGILLGRITRGDRIHITIDDAEPVPVEYAFGPSFLLSEKDLQHFHAALAKWEPGPDRERYAVGFYRGHTRDALALDPADIQLFREHFQDPLQIVLLVKPHVTKPCVGAFFMPESGSVAGAPSPLEFPFSRAELGGGTTPETAPSPIQEAPPASARPRRNRSPIQTAVLETPPDSEQQPPSFDAPLPDRSDTSAAVPAQPRRQWKRTLAWVSFAFALAAFLGVLYYRLSGGEFPSAVRFKSPGVVTAGPPAAATLSPYTLGLLAERADNNVLVRWNQDAPAIKAATHGMLRVTEGLSGKDVPLDAAQLQHGTVLYRHIAPEIGFRLEVMFAGNRSLVETISWKSQ